jgi:DNA-binding LacI/PurR family transcriptional regulator
MGYGFTETTSMFNPPLAVINQDPRKMGLVAASRLIDEIDGKVKAGARLVIEEEFIINKSIR